MHTYIHTYTYIHSFIHTETANVDTIMNAAPLLLMLRMLTVKMLTVKILIPMLMLMPSKLVLLPVSLHMYRCCCTTAGRTHRIHPRRCGRVPIRTAASAAVPLRVHQSSGCRSLSQHNAHPRFLSRFLHPRNPRAHKGVVAVVYRQSPEAGAAGDRHGQRRDCHDGTTYAL
jgi:hypothetical protein